MGVELGQLLPAGAQVSQVIPLTGAVHSDAVEVMAQLSIGEAAQQLHHPGAGAAPLQHSVGDAGVVNAEAHNVSAESFSVFLCRVDEGHELFVLDVAIFDHVPGELAPVDGTVEDVAPAFVAAGVGLHRDDGHVFVFPVAQAPSTQVTSRPLSASSRSPPASFGAPEIHLPPLSRPPGCAGA